MKIIPSVRIARFEQLQPGDLFVLLGHQQPCLALKTAKAKDGDREEMVLLGPAFPHDIKEATIVPWEATTTVSYGQDYSLLLPTDPSAWFQDGDTRTPICLAVTDEDVFVCANGGNHSQRFFQCYVNLRTGEISENKISNIKALTRTWELVIAEPRHEPRSLLKSPLPAPE